MDSKEIVRFVLIFIVAHIVAYWIAGIIAYFTLYQPFFEGEEALLSCFMRMRDDPELWPHVMKWQTQGQVLRAILFAVVMLPFFTTWKEWKLSKRIWTVLVAYFILTHFAATAPSGGNIEGFIYMRPEFVEDGFWKYQPEAIIHGLIMAGILAKWGIRRRKEQIT
ncbi:hypothetical protein ACFLU5_05230 [Bacteroidota bacterium]